MFFFRSLASAVVASVVLVPGALAAGPPPNPPPPERALEQPVNLGDFPAHPPEVAQYLRRHRNERGDQARAASLRKKRLARSSTRAGVVACGGVSNGFTRSLSQILSDGHARCPTGQSGGAADLLGALACWDIWATGQYWSRLGCGSWNTRAAALYVAAYAYYRTCSAGRYYRPSVQVSITHGTAVSANYPGNYGYC